MTEIVPSPTLRLADRIFDLQTPLVMGILNATPDSFYTGSRLMETDHLLKRAENMLLSGATLLDIGGASSRPGAAVVSADEEMTRVVPAIQAIRREFPEAMISVDTWRHEVAAAAIDLGAVMVNDISAGTMDPELWPVLARYAEKEGQSVAYVLMHMQGTPDTMQVAPHYEDVVVDILDFFIQKTNRLNAMGISEIVLDPGFGFGKTLPHNFRLLKNLSVFRQVTGLPVLAGLSRKSMISKTLGIKTNDALNGTTALHMAALLNGAAILRAHDVPEAVQTVKLYQALEDA